MNKIFLKTEPLSLRLLKITLALCLATPFLAFSNFIFPYTVPKVFAFRVLVEIAAVFYLYLALKYPKIFCHSGRSESVEPESRPARHASWFTSVAGAVSFFLFISFLSAIFGADFYNSFWGNLERGGGVFGLLHFIAFFFMLVSVFRIDSSSPLCKRGVGGDFYHRELTSVIPAKAGIQAPGSRSKFVHRIAGGGFKNQDFSHQLIIVSVFTSALISLLAIFQHFFSLSDLLPQVDRVYSLIGNAGVLGSYLVFNIFLAGYLMLLEFTNLPARQSPEAKPMAGWVICHLNSFGYCLAFIITSSALLLSATRGAWLGLLAGIIVFLVLSFFAPPSSVIPAKAGIQANQKNSGSRITRLAEDGESRRECGMTNKRKQVVFLFLVLIFILAISLFSFRNSSFVKNNSTLSRLASISLNDSTALSRLILWQGAWQTWQSKPLLGFGSENFETAIGKYISPQLANFEAYSTDRAHNFIFDYGVTIGWLGLLSYLSIFIVVGYFLFTLSKVPQKGTGSKGHSDPTPSVIPALHPSVAAGEGGQAGIQANQKNSGSRITRLARRACESRRESGMTENEKDKFLFSVIFISLLVAYLVQNLFIFDSFVSYLMLFFILAIISSAEGGRALPATQADSSESGRGLPATQAGLPALRAGEESSQNVKLSLRHLSPFVSCLLYLVSFLLLFVIYSYNLKPFIAANYANQILSLPASEATQISPLLKNVTALNSFASPEITYQVTIDYIDKISQNTALVQNEEFYNVASAELSKIIAHSPNQPRNYIALSWLNLYFSGQEKTRIDQSLQLSQKVRELSPNKKDAYLLLVAGYALSGQPQKALETVDQAIAIDAKMGEEVRAYLERLK